MGPFVRRRSPRLLNLTQKTGTQQKVSTANVSHRSLATRISPKTAKKAAKVQATLDQSYEERKYKKNYKVIVGVDEAGRGPLAGPVVAAACYIPVGIRIEGVQDSKKLDEAQRESLYEKLTTHPDIKYVTHINDAQRIDEINILQATLESMAKCVQNLPLKADFAFIDGNRMPKLDIDAETVVKGDSKVYSIAAASIIAKVTRDRLMVEFDAKWPQYGFAQHKGYPTRAHVAAITQSGPCPIHRMTFAPLKHM